MKTVPLFDLKAQYATIREEIRAAIDRVCETQDVIMGPELKLEEEEVGAFCRARADEYYIKTQARCLHLT
jgi:dTDP-4-amino-4,6-dideoxygalactose transaminase